MIRKNNHSRQESDKKRILTRKTQAMLEKKESLEEKMDGQNKHE